MMTTAQSASSPSHTFQQPDPALVMEGIDNLLDNCMELQSGETVLIVLEDPRLAYFDPTLGEIISDQAIKRGAVVHRLIAPRINAPENSPTLIKDAMLSADHTLFLARIGDQMRFFPLPGNGKKIMCYALDPIMLASGACRMPYGVMVDTLAEIQSDLDQKSSWHVTCPRGTDLSGTYDPDVYSNKGRLDFTLKLFPVGPFRPLTCNTASGRLVTSILPASATHLYEPFGIALEAPVTLEVEEGRIVDFLGRVDIADRVRKHYQHVGETLNIDPYVVHSWHCGTNPQIIYPAPALDNIERWNGVIHSHPRYTHFHTCGDYGPGEIAVSIIDATIRFDEEEYWRDGTLVQLEQDRFQHIAKRYGCGDDVFDMCTTIGL